MTCFERVQDALSKLRDHLRALVSSSRVTELEEKLEASEREMLRITEAVEGFVAGRLPKPTAIDRLAEEEATAAAARSQPPQPPEVEQPL